MENQPDPTTFDLVGQEGRIARMSRMIAQDEKITPARKDEIRRRVSEYLAKHNLSQKVIAQQCNTGKGTVSEVLRGVYGQGKGKGSCDDTEYLRRFNNWMELDARRRNIVSNRDFVETGVAKEIITVAEIVSETCKMGVIYGPAQIGKSFTLESIRDSDQLGNPILIRVNQSCLAPVSFARALCDLMGLSVGGAFDALTRRLVKALVGTKRMIMVDEAERARYATLEFIRDLHDMTGCPVLLAGKPAIYQRLGFRDMGDYKEVVDQLASRIVIRRDLTERTRRDDHNPQPLFSAEDVRKLIQVAQLDIAVTRDAERWLQDRASVVGLGGIGKAKIILYLAYKYALASGADAISVEHLEAVEESTIGYEDVDRVEEIVHEPSARRIRRLG